MPANLEQIESIRDQTLAQIESLLSSPAPTITVNGEEVPWPPLLAELSRTVDWCDRKLADYEPYEVKSRAET